jgi:lipase chaperone LimK
VKQRGLAIAAALAIALLAPGGAWWTAQDGSSAAPATQVPLADSATVAAASASMARLPPGTVPTAGAPDAFLQPGLRHRIEQLLLDVGPADTPQELKRKLLAQLHLQFSAAEATRAAELVGRYVDYRVAVSQLKPPKDMGDPHALRQALQARQQARRQHFTDEEWQALFEQEEQLDRFTIARLEILRNPSLDAQQKQEGLRAAESELPPAQRAARSEAVLHETVAAQSAAFEAAGTLDQQRHAQRSAAYGEAAAQRLGELDREERDWQSRLERYAALQASTRDASQLEAARQQLFTPQEQLRLEPALALRQMAKR